MIKLLAIIKQYDQTNNDKAIWIYDQTIDKVIWSSKW